MFLSLEGQRFDLGPLVRVTESDHFCDSVLGYTEFSGKGVCVKLSSWITCGD